MKVLYLQCFVFKQDEKREAKITIIRFAPMAMDVLVWVESNFIFENMNTIQCKFKASRQSNAIFKASRQSNASSNFKSSGLCVWATGPWWHERHDASYVWSTSTRGWTTISTSYSIIIQCTISNIDRRKYHKNITVCTLCNHNMCKVQCVNHNAITMAQTARGQSWPGHTVPTAANLVQTQSLYEDSECLYSD